MMPRRDFLTVVARALHGVVGVMLTVPALRFLLDPLWRTRKEVGFIRVAPLDSTLVGPPLRSNILADRWDAYMHHPPGPIGNVWLLRAESDDRDPKIRCLHVICPHLGCAIDYAVDCNVFHCPCHASEFDSEGRRRFGPSPRDMDELECRITEPDDHGERWVEVKYQEFQTGVPEKRSTV